MVVKSFFAQVAGGQLRHVESLDVFEGQAVQVTLIGPAEQPPAATTVSDEPPDWLDVEHDVVIQMPRRVELLHKGPVVDRGQLPLCIVLPEDWPVDVPPFK